MRVVGAGELHLDRKHNIQVGEHTVRASQSRWGVQQLPRLGEIEGLLLLVRAELRLVCVVLELSSARGLNERGS
jgi:hypothetical protein